MKWTAELRRVIFVSNTNSRLQYWLKDCRNLFIYREQTVVEFGISLSAIQITITLQDVEIFRKG